MLPVPLSYASITPAPTPSCPADAAVFKELVFLSLAHEFLDGPLRSCVLRLDPDLCDAHTRSGSVGLILALDPLRRPMLQLCVSHHCLEFHLADTNSYIPTGKTLNQEQEEVLGSKPVVAALIDELERLCPPLASALAEELFSPTRCLMQCGNYFTATPSASASSSSQTLAHCMTGFPPAINESCSREKIQSRYITTINPVHSMGVVLQFLAIDAYWVLMGFEC
jgi:hypothetical protein